MYPSLWSSFRRAGLPVLIGLTLPSPGSARFLHKPDTASQDFVFEAKPREITARQAATLYWSMKGVTRVFIEAASRSDRELRPLGSFAAPGSLRVTPKEDTTYVVSCEGSPTYSCASVTVRVKVKPR